MSEVQVLLESKIENPTDLLKKINDNYSFITKEYVLNADLNEITRLKGVKEVINNSKNGLLAKIDMFIDVINAEIKPVMEPLMLAKRQLKGIVDNIRELDLIEKNLIITNNYNDCCKIVIENLPDCKLTINKMKYLDFFRDLEKKAKTIDFKVLAGSFVKKYIEEIEIINQQAIAYVDDYHANYDLQKVLLKKMEVENIKQKEKQIEIVKTIDVVEPVEPNVIDSPIFKKATFEIEYTQEQAKLLNDFVNILKQNNIKYKIVK